MKKFFYILLIIFFFPLVIAPFIDFEDEESEKTNLDSIEKITLKNYKKEIEFNISELINEKKNFLENSFMKLIENSNSNITEEIKNYKELENYYLNELNVLNKRLNVNQIKKTTLEKYEIQLMNESYFTFKTGIIKDWSTMGNTRRFLIDLLKDFIVDWILSAILFVIFIIVIGLFFNFFDWLDIYEDYKWGVIVLTIIIALIFNPSKWIFDEIGETIEENVNLFVSKEINENNTILTETLRNNIDNYEK